MTLIMLPVRAPMLLVLLLISTYLGLHWSRPGSWADAGLGDDHVLIWSAECLQALVVVLVCTMPDLLLRRLSSTMAASRAASLVITLLLVVTGGLYLLHLDVLSNVLILASAVLLARLDLLRVRVMPPPFVMTGILTLLVLGGITLGRTLEVELRPWLHPTVEHPGASHRGEHPSGEGPRAPEPRTAPPRGDGPGTLRCSGRFHRGPGPDAERNRPGTRPGRSPSAAERHPTGRGALKTTPPRATRNHDRIRPTDRPQ
ncbi:MAG: hypothetical protein ACKO0M_10100 [Cyanobium sp.]